MRRGFSLTEVLTVLVVLAIISIPLAELSKLIIYDIPKSQKLIESNTSILDVLEYIRKDVNSALRFPRTIGKYSANENSLLIEQRDKTICYTAGYGEISRIVIDGEERKFTWRIPDGKIEWQIWRKDDIGYAVEVIKYIELKSHNRVFKKMPNSYVYFTGTYSCENLRVEKPETKK